MRTVSDRRPIRVRVALYARVSTDSQEARGTIASQLEVLRARAVHDEHEVVAEFLDDGHSGARLDRPGLDRLRDEAEAGLFDAVLCLTPDRLARVYAYQALVREQVERAGVRVRATDAPAFGDEPHARLRTRTQGGRAAARRANVASR